MTPPRAKRVVSAQTPPDALSIVKLANGEYHASIKAPEKLDQLAATADVAARNLAEDLRMLAAKVERYAGALAAPDVDAWQRRRAITPADALVHLRGGALINMSYTDAAAVASLLDHLGDVERNLELITGQVVAAIRRLPDGVMVKFPKLDRKAL